MVVPLATRCARIDLQNEMDEVACIPIENAAASIREAKLRDYSAGTRSAEEAGTLWWDDDERSPYVSRNESAPAAPSSSPSSQERDHDAPFPSVLDAWRNACRYEKNEQEEFEKRSDLAVRVPGFHLPPFKRLNTPWYFDDGICHLERQLAGLDFREARYRASNFERYMREDEGGGEDYRENMA